MEQYQCTQSCITCKRQIKMNWNFGNNPCLSLSSNFCHKKMLIESLTIPLSLSIKSCKLLDLFTMCSAECWGINLFGLFSIVSVIVSMLAIDLPEQIQFSKTSQTPADRMVSFKGLPCLRSKWKCFTNFVWVSELILFRCKTKPFKPTVLHILLVVSHLWHSAQY